MQDFTARGYGWMLVKPGNRQNLQLGRSRDIVFTTWIPSANVWRILTVPAFFFVFLDFDRDWFHDFRYILFYICCDSFMIISMQPFTNHRISVLTKIQLSATFNDRIALNCMHISLTVCITFCVNLVGFFSSFRYMF